MINIQTDDGDWMPVYLYPTNGGWTGPRSEFYRTMPNATHLTKIYGHRRPQPSRPPREWDRADDGNPPPPGGGVLEATVVQGRINITQGNRTLSVIKPTLPNVENWKFVNGRHQIIVKSRGNHGPAMVEKFNTAGGVLVDKVMAAAIRKSGATWARGFED